MKNRDNRFKRSILLVSRIFKWFGKGIYFWLFVVQCLLAFIFAFKLNNALTAYGIVLQIFGAALIIRSLSAKLEIFRKHNIGRMILEYLREFPIFRGARAETSARLRGTSKMEGPATVIIKPPGNDITDVIRYFDQVIEDLKEEMNTRFEHHKKTLEDLKAQQVEEIESIKNAIVKTANKMESVVLSNPWQELYGISTILLGLLITLMSLAS